MKKRKIKWKNVIITIIILILSTTLVISITNILKWYNDGKNTKKQVEIINQNVEIEEVEDNIETEIIQPVKEIPKANPYWDYIKIPLVNVDFKELKKKNNDVKGWIQVNGTNINYPFVQAKNNDYYLTHSFDKSVNLSGWVFMDYRNNIENFDKNTIIYAHGRTDGIMFGTLKNIINSYWYDNPNNYIIKLSTEYENTLWQVFSTYKIPTTSDYIQTDFQNDNEYQEFLNLIKNRSSFNFNTEISTTDKVLTLSTCYNNEIKVVMHAKLIKIQKK